MKRSTLFILLAAVILIIVCAAIVWFYFLNTLFGFRQFSVEKLYEEEDQEIVEVQLEGDYQGRYEVIDQKGVKMSIPLGRNDNEEFVITDDEDSPLNVDGNDYIITIGRLKGKPYRENYLVDDQLKEFYNGCSSRHEYQVKNLLEGDISNKDDYEYPVIIQISDEYAVVEKDSFIFIITLRYASKGRGYESVEVEVYDTSKDYDLIVDIDIWKFSLTGFDNITIEEIDFIVNSLEISDY